MTGEKSTKSSNISDSLFFATGATFFLFGLYLILVLAESGILVTGFNLGLLAFGLLMGFVGAFIMANAQGSRSSHT